MKTADPAELCFRGTVVAHGDTELIVQPAWPFKGHRFSLPSKAHEDAPPEKILERIYGTMKLRVTSIMCGNDELLDGGAMELGEEGGIPMFALLGQYVEMCAITPAERIIIRCRNRHNEPVEAYFSVYGERG